jgi:pyridoxamine 5'-phosphate oxidase
LASCRLGLTRALIEPKGVRHRSRRMSETTTQRTLREEIDRIWSLLARGVADKRSPFNVPTVATVDAQGHAQVRTVVLRDCAPSERKLTFHTDCRSRKFDELTANPELAWHVWAPRQKLQVRISGRAALYHDNAVALAAWEQLHAGSRAIYKQALTPGTQISSPDASAAAPALSSSVALENFVLVETLVTAIEWLELAPDGHLRGLATWDPQKQDWEPHWLAP